MARPIERHIYGVGDRLSLAVKRSGMNLTELSEKTGVLAPHISSMMHSDATMHEFSIARLCVALNISADWLLGLTVIDRKQRSIGEWLEVYDGVSIGDGKHLECSACGVWKKDRQKSNFCSHCGAEMKGGEG